MEIKINSKKHGEKVVIIDDKDYELIKGYNWHIIKHRNTYYALNNSIGRMHRFILSLNDKNIVVDHKNHNGLDNRKENLRVCSVQDNNKNVKTVSEEASSKYKGVFWNKEKGLWSSIIKSDKIGHFLGYFNDEIIAARAYDQVARFLHKDFSWLNFQNENYEVIENLDKVLNRKEYTSSKYRGVNKCAKTGKWRSTIFVDGKKVWLGLHETEENAALARNKYITENNLDRRLNDMGEF